VTTLGEFIEREGIFAVLAAFADPGEAKRRRREHHLQRLADEEHERVWQAGCECETPTVGPVTGRCGRCVGVIGAEPLPRSERNGQRTMPTYQEVVADFRARPLASHCSCEACRELTSRAPRRLTPA
jgi:hypothetical protein